MLLIFLSDIAIIDANQEVVTLALTSPIEDIEDALQYYTAVQHRMDFFISRDRNFQEQALSILPVHNVSEFLKLIN